MAFQSLATNLVPNDTNETFDTFLHELPTAHTERLSVGPNSTQGNNYSGAASLSATGQDATLNSEASNLVTNDSNGVEDVFIRDRQARETTLVSVASDGTQANYSAGNPDISADGRFIAFESIATNLVDAPGLCVCSINIYLHDRATGGTSLVSVAPDGSAGNKSSSRPAISADGRIIAFRSRATNLVPNDTNGFQDVFVHDRLTGATELASVASDGTEAFGESFPPAISADGRYVAFVSEASNLIPDDTNRYCFNPGDADPGCGDVFVRDRLTGQTERVSVASDGTEGNDSAMHARPAISADGRYVAFWSLASNLVPGDTNDLADLFRHDRLTGITERVTMAYDGSQLTDPSYDRSLGISADGSRIAFASYADNLVPDDTNNSPDAFVRIMDPEPNALTVDALTARGGRGAWGAVLLAAVVVGLAAGVRQSLDTGGGDGEKPRL